MPDDKLEERLKRQAQPLPTGKLARLWRMGRTAARVGTSLVGRGISPAQAEAITRGLGELKGLAMKGGQMLSYLDVTLPEELRGALVVLQQAAQPSPWGEVEAQLRAGLGPQAEALLAGLDPTPRAVASIGQVHFGRLPDGTEVAVKVRHPGIEAALQSDFAGAEKVGSPVAALMGVEIAGYVGEAKAMLLAECDYRLEAERQVRFAALLAGDETLRIPRVLPQWSCREVLTTQWEAGERLEAFLARATEAERDRAGEAMYRFHLASLYRHQLFHADPHPGNYAFRGAGAGLEVVVYDFGSVRAFTRPAVAALARTAAAVRRDDMPAAFAALAEVGARAPSDAAERQLLRGLMRGYFAPLLTPGPRPLDLSATWEARDLLADKRRLMKLRLPPDMLFLFRLRFGLYSVLHRMGARVDWAGLEMGWAGECGLDRRAGAS